MSGAAVQFDYSAWSARYPELVAAGVTQNFATLYFGEAGLYLRNDGTGPVSDASIQLALLNMATAHIAALNVKDGGGQLEKPLVGRVSSASEGSVTVSLANEYPPGSAQWWQQTPYGAQFWSATAGYRTMRYRSNIGRNMNPWLLPTRI